MKVSQQMSVNIALHRNQEPEVEYPFDNLSCSGDEAIEQSFMKSTIQDNRGSKTNNLFTCISIMKCMIGFGILGIPNVVKNFGLLGTILLLILTGSASVYSSKLMLKNKNLSKHSNFTTIGLSIFKSQWIDYAMKFMIIISNLGMMLGELMQQNNFNDLAYMQPHHKTQQDYLMQTLHGIYPGNVFLIIAGIILAPFMIVQKIEKLRFINLTALLSLFLFTIFVIYNFIITEQIETSIDWYPVDFNFYSAFVSLPTLILAYTWQYNLYPIFKGMTIPTDANLMACATLSHIGGFSIYMTVGLLGYATYGQNVQTNYLEVIKVDSVGETMYLILNITFVLSTTLTQPLIYFGARKNFLSMLQQQVKRSEIRGRELDYKNIDDIKEVSRQKKRKMKIIGDLFSLFVFTLLILLSLYVKHLDVIFNFLGIICANCIQLVVPCLFYIMIIKKQQRVKSKYYYATSILLAISLCLVVVCISSQFL
ncbi:hypothetical protein pb186bvf_017343 [Paramecium bursaria]